MKNKNQSNDPASMSGVDSSAMLEAWANVLPERRTILAFWDWLSERRQDDSLLDINVEKELDRYQGIDQAQLEKERSALLESLSSSNSPVHSPEE